MLDTSVAMTNKARIAAWVKDHGEDSDFIRVRGRGVFPRTDSQQFIEASGSTRPWRARRGSNGTPDHP